MSAVRPPLIAGDRVIVSTWPSLGPATVIETGVRFPESYPGRPTVLLRTDALPDRPHWFFADECTHAESVQTDPALMFQTQRQDLRYPVPGIPARAVTTDTRS